ncbi:MAG: Ldh family oxidoreductase [Desulfovibrio sp.]|nr:Ldh family oxidoreductase [Desulfovibrio sp.]
MNTSLAVGELRSLCLAAFAAAGIPASVAETVVEALLDAELDGISSHGLSRLPFYADQAMSGKVRANAVPVTTNPAPGVVLVDACNGFAFPAINAGLDAAFARVAEQGICSLGVRRSHHCGVLGHFVAKIAAHGLIGLAFANTPAAMAPWGGRRRVFGTNPLAFGCPRDCGEPVVIDLSLSVVARGKVMLARQHGEKLPPGWALDVDGRETTDPDAALAGTMTPLGGAKGVALAMMVEMLAATLTGSSHASEASSLFDAHGPPPNLGQFFLLIDPKPFNPAFLSRVEALCNDVLSQENTRLPGMRRQQERRARLRAGLSIPVGLLAELRRRADASSPGKGFPEHEQGDEQARAQCVHRVDAEQSVQAVCQQRAKGRAHIRQQGIGHEQ